MTPEMMFAQALSKPTTEKEKIASVVQQMSVDELADFLRADVEHVTRRREWREADAPAMLGHEKTAAEKTHDPGWWKAQKGMMRAMRAGDEGGDKAFAHPDLISARLKGMAGGAALGGLAGHAFTRRAGTGALVGALAGGIGSEGSYLRKRGVHQKAFGLGGAEFTDEAARKYLKEKKSSADLFELADGWGREMAHQHLEKVALTMGALQTGIGTLARKAVTTGAGTRMAVGAGIGAAGGAVKHMASKDPNSSLLGNMAVGAGLGAGAGYGAKAAVQTLGSTNTGVGRYLTGGMAQSAHKAGDAAGLAAAKTLSKERAVAAAEARRVAAAKAAPTITATPASAAPKITNPTAGPSPILDASGKPFRSLEGNIANPGKGNVIYIPGQ